MKGDPEWIRITEEEPKKEEPITYSRDLIGRQLVDDVGVGFLPFSLSLFFSKLKERKRRKKKKLHQTLLL